MSTNANKISNKIKRLMNKMCIKPSFIARSLCVTGGYISHCINIDQKTRDFRRKDPYVREGIARHLGLSYRELWGEPQPQRIGKELKELKKILENAVLDY